MAASPKQMEQAYSLAKERYAALGVDVEAAVSGLARVAISLHCWQGDDVGGFENAGEELRRRHLAARATIPGKARTRRRTAGRRRQGLVADPRQAPLQPARHLRRDRRQDGRAQRDRAGAFPALDRLGQGARASGMDFNPTYFSHPKAADGFTLAHRDEGIRRFWVEHGIACRKIGAAIGQAPGHALRDQRLDPRRL